MSDFINKVVTVILVFVMLVIAPILISYKSDEMLAKREILNEVEIFIDKVQDTSAVSSDDIDKLYVDCNSHGLAVDVTVKRLIVTETFNSETDETETHYFAVSDDESLKNINAGDIIQVFVEEVTSSPARTATHTILGIDEGKFSFELAGVVG